MRLSAFILFSFFSLILFGQSNQGEYLEAKRQYSLGNYQVAQQSFAQLSDDAVFGEYASFYYAMASFRLGEKKEAEDMLKQIEVKYPDWDQQQEVNYWLSYLAFDKRDYYRAFRLVDRLPEDWKLFLIDTFLSKTTVSELDAAYTLNPENEFLAKYLFEALGAKPANSRDQYRLEELAEKFGFVLSIEESMPLIKKEKYAIAAVLPFMFDSLEAPQSVIRNSIIFDLYQGMLQAQADLEKENRPIEIYPYDTKKLQSAAMRMVRTGDLENADVIVGPLYAGPMTTLSKYSRERNVTMVNPLSSNGAILSDNPFSYLIKPSYETQGRKAAEFAARRYSDNKKVFIFYESLRDSLMAAAYKEVIQRDSFFVIRFERLTNEDAQQIQQEFTEQFEVRLDTMYSNAEMDSIAKLPGRTVRERSLRNEETGRIVKDREGKDVIETYEVKFTVAPDSIGHIFAATSSNVLANNLISLAEVRSDSIGIIGLEDWLDFSLISFQQLERLEVNFVSPDFMAKDSVRYQKVKEAIGKRTGQLPNKYHLQGYELIWHLGNMLHTHGKYFQRGWRNGDYIPGHLGPGFQYGIYNDNQVVPITRIRELKLENQNVNSTVGSADEDTDQ